MMPMLLEGLAAAGDRKDGTAYATADRIDAAEAELEDLRDELARLQMSLAAKPSDEDLGVHLTASEVAREVGGEE